MASPPVVEFTLSTPSGGAVVGAEAEGGGRFLFTLAKLVPADAGVPAYWQSYTNRLEVADDKPDIPDALPLALQGYADQGGTLEAGDVEGSYVYTYGTDPTNVTTPVPVAYDPALTHRVGFEYRIDGNINPDNPFFDFVPAGGDPASREIVTDDSCNACHKRLALHGSGRFNTGYCNTCHNPFTRDQNSGALVDLPHMAHAMHAAEFRREQSIELSCTDQGGTLTRVGRSELCLLDPTDETTVVETDDTLFTYVVYGHNDSKHDYNNLRYPQDVLRCETCHDAGEGADGGLWNENYSAEACGACHVSVLEVSEPDPDTGLSTYAIQHAFPSDPQVNGSCGNCHGAGIVVTNFELHSQVIGSTRLRQDLGELFKFEILGADLTDLAAPKVTIKITNPADGSAYDILTDPEFTVLPNDVASLSIWVSWSTDDIYNGDEDGNLVNFGGRSDEGRGLRMELEDIQASVPAPVKNEDGSFTVTFFQALPANVGDFMISLGGHPDVNGERAYAESAVYLNPDATKNRRKVVQEAKCNACHYKLAMHGGNRVLGDYRICLNCHNSELGHFEHVEDENAHGQIGDFIDSISLSVLVHNLHAGSPTYFAGEFSDVALPIAARLDLCGICHIEGTYNGPAATARAITIYRGDDASVWTDDVVDSPWTGICTNCHVSQAAENHMLLNGGQLGGGIEFDPITELPVPGTGSPLKSEFTAGTGLPIFSNEACEICHKAGGIADVAEAHMGVLPPDTGGH
jgi:OmcA/MtrC family decaheme c-type cytochrome